MFSQVGLSNEDSGEEVGDGMGKPFLGEDVGEGEREDDEFDDVISPNGIGKLICLGEDEEAGRNDIDSGRGGEDFPKIDLLICNPSSYECDMSSTGADILISLGVGEEEERNDIGAAGEDKDVPERDLSLYVCIKFFAGGETVIGMVDVPNFVLESIRINL
ncbi:hypothetical protein NPIL_420151 [Nephila pilipes]|uniref:Uncharacterized protein n=1 Tax=Nephila pilipes TaxID=299642 RepID=A0A8X6JCI4_NEPPI|nr:hypothetical protein NPIL_420151 [Nephila pilipes]